MSRAARHHGGHRDEERRKSFLKSPITFRRPTHLTSTVTSRKPTHLRPRQRISVVAVLLALLAGSVVWVVSNQSNSAWAGTLSLLPDNAVPRTLVDPDTTPTELGLRFKVAVPSDAIGVQFYKGPKNTGKHTATLWNSSGKRLARVTFKNESRTGLQWAQFSKPVSLKAKTTYIVSYTARVGRYSVDEHYFTRTVGNRYIKAGRNAGVYNYHVGKFPKRTYNASNYAVDIVIRPNRGKASAGFVGIPPTPTTGSPTDSATPTPSGAPTTSTPSSAPTTSTPSSTPTSRHTKRPSPTRNATTAPSSGTPTTTPPSSTPSGAFPNASNTGVPSGVTLTAYTGPCRITAAGTVIDGKTVNCDLNIAASNVVIRNSVVNGMISTDSGSGLLVQDSEVRIGNHDGTGIGNSGFTVERVEVTGGNRSINCEKNCTVRDSYVHGQFTDKTGVFHESGIRMGSGSTIVHNTITCDAPDVPPDAGCSAGLTGYGDFAAVENNLIQDNLFLASTGGTCAYGGSSKGKPYTSGANNIRFIDNTFERGKTKNCGIWSPIMDFDRSAPGNVWSGNVWSDGGAVSPVG